MSYNPANDPRINIPMTEIHPGMFLRIKIMPCSVNPFVAAETIIPQLLKAFIGFEGPDPKHIYHAAAGQSLLKDLRFEFAEAEILEPEVGDILDQVTRMVWKIDAEIDEVVWWLFLIGLAAEFFIDWSSEVYRLSGCTHAGMGGWIRSGNNECVYTTHEGWDQCCQFTNCSTSDGTTTTVASQFPTGGFGESWSLQVTSEWVDVGGHGIPTAMRIRDATADKVLDTGGAYGSLFGPEQWSMTMMYDQPAFAEKHVLVIEAMNTDDTSVNEVFGNRGGYFQETYTLPPTPISVDWKGPFLSPLGYDILA